MMNQLGTFELISNEELVDAIENDQKESVYKKQAELLLMALDDWPTFNLEDPKDLLKTLKETINDDLTYKNLSWFLSKLNPIVDGWKMEALSSLLEIFTFEQIYGSDKSVTLDQIVQQLTIHYKK